MEENLKDMDFGYFIGQVVTGVNTDEHAPLVIQFEKGSLIVECPWRLCRNNEIILGETDCISAPDKFTYKEIYKIIGKKKIVGIDNFMGRFFVITFEDQIIFELFHASSYFEGWNLIGDNGFGLFTIPGGEYA
ncbi:hypothetical protein [Marininema halotolerans]|uniref:Uncharacterized protein n=1 Tax=Marininema halotolerans TaxID=1155944 RepID=A0A1I6UCC6_9BACL|nr:hypothetical protein [Marininema halotolerans]SFS98957.1 hypothetical protein SAMN05444972_11537 [Marininema halotolerans]